jgi:hypothetical protein
MGVAVAVGAAVAVGETTDVGVADGSTVAVAVGWGRGMGIDSLQEAASTDTPSARGRTCLAMRRKVWPTVPPPQVPSQVLAF